MPTLFERIISGELPADFVYRDEQVVAFRDIHPRAPTHLLIVPVKPIPTLNDVTGADDERCSATCSWWRPSSRAREGIADRRLPADRQLQSSRRQEVYHLHLHLIGGKPLGPMVSV